jgi:hypothetical protein
MQQQKLHLRQLKVKPLNQFRLVFESVKEPIQKVWVDYLKYLSLSLSEDDYLEFLEAKISPKIYDQANNEIKMLVEAFDEYSQIEWLAPPVVSLPAEEIKEPTQKRQRKSWWKKYRNSRGK